MKKTQIKRKITILSYAKKEPINLIFYCKDYWNVMRGLFCKCFTPGYRYGSNYYLYIDKGFEGNYRTKPQALSNFRKID